MGDGEELQFRPGSAMHCEGLVGRIVAPGPQSASQRPVPRSDPRALSKTPCCVRDRTGRDA